MFAKEKILNKLTIGSFADLQATKIGILGGTFDPPHNGHLEIARKILSKYQLDCVVFIPAKKNPLKPSGPIASDSERVAMLELLIGTESNLFISTMELDNTKGSYTVDTLKDIKAQLSPDASIYLILGTDNLFDQDGRTSSLPHWKNKSEIFQLAQLTFVARGDFQVTELEKLDPDKYSPAELEEIKGNVSALNLDISATDIRAGFAQAKPQSDFLPAPLNDFIMKNNIYR